MGTERGERLVLQRVDARVELVAAPLVRAPRPGRSSEVGAGDLHVEDRRNRTPHVGDGLRGRQGRGRARNGRPAVEQLHVGRQRDADADEAVLRQVGEVVRGSAVAPEVVGVDGAEERVVDTRAGHPNEARRGRGGGELEALGRHVAIGARTAVAAEARKGPVVEVRLSAAEARIDWGVRHARDRLARIGRTLVAVVDGGTRQR